MTPGEVTPLVVGDTVLGAGPTKICLPVVAGDVDGVRRSVRAAPEALVDLIEVRLDHLLDVTQAPRALEVTREALASRLPVVATFRSRREGGARELTPRAYEELAVELVRTGLCDLLDVELSTPQPSRARLVEEAHRFGVQVIVSSHDFESTPCHEGILDLLRREQQTGADVVKVAVMPQSPADVLTLMSATQQFVAEQATRPVATMAMGAMGVASRLMAESFGSCLTFGSAGRSSAPGQVEVGALRRTVDLLHEALAATP